MNFFFSICIYLYLTSNKDLSHFPPLPSLSLSFSLSLNLKCQNHEKREIIYLGALSHKMIKKIPRVEKIF